MTYDSTCPHYLLRYYDALCSPLAEHNCGLTARPGISEYGPDGSTDYSECNEPNHKFCPLHLSRFTPIDRYVLMTGLEKKAVGEQLLLF